MTTVNGVSVGTTARVVSKDQTGFNSLKSEDFLKMLITELQNQDPTQPVDNSHLLEQLSVMRNLQANLELGEAMKSITASQKLATAASFVGKNVKGVDVDGTSVTGKVGSAFLSNDTFYVRIGEKTIKLDDVTEVVSAD